MLEKSTRLRWNGGFRPWTAQPKTHPQSRRGTTRVDALLLATVAHRSSFGTERAADQAAFPVRDENQGRQAPATPGPVRVSGTMLAATG